MANSPDRNNFLDDGSQNDDLAYGTEPEASDEKKPGVLELPQIQNRNNGPFKGFVDIGVVSHKLRRSLGSAGKQARNNSARVEERDFGSNTIQAKVGLKDQFKDQFKAAIKNKTTMSPKVLETWINETLTDAEHLDIPGVILKPEAKNPIQRYGIDRHFLQKEGIPGDAIDRIYRAMFVYSVGWYELLKKCLEHSNNKYTVIANMWKVFSILLEYCCRQDYKMLI